MEWMEKPWFSESQPIEGPLWGETSPARQLPEKRLLMAAERLELLLLLQVTPPKVLEP